MGLESLIVTGKGGPVSIFYGQIFSVIGGGTFFYIDAIPYSPGHAYVSIDNTTTECVINGYKEPGSVVLAMCPMSCTSPQIVNQTLSGSNFSYKVYIPKNVDQEKIMFHASKIGKSEGYGEITIQRSPSQLTESQYKDSCQLINSNEFEKNPDKYAGQKVKYNGTVKEIHEYFLQDVYITEIIMEINDKSGNQIYVTSYNTPTKALKNSTITIYGTVDETYTFKSGDGQQKTLPKIIASYIDVK